MLHAELGAGATSALELGQIGDDDGAKNKIASFLSLAVGFTGWTANVVVAGRVRTGDSIVKLRDPDAAKPAEGEVVA